MLGAMVGIATIIGCCPNISSRSKARFLAYAPSPLTASGFPHDGNKKSPRPTTTVRQLGAGGRG